MIVPDARHRKWAMTSIEIFTYAAAGYFLVRRFDRNQTKQNPEAHLPQKRSITIGANPDVIAPHLKRSLSGIKFEMKAAPEGRGTELAIYSDSEDARKFLRAIKMVVETGEVATVAGQTHGTPLKSSISNQIEHAVHKLIHRRDLKNATEV
jgi:hypothetical protein